MSTTTIVHVQDRVERGLRSRKKLASENDRSAKTIRVTIEAYRMRKARQVGILGGKDRIRSAVRVTDPTKQDAVVGEYIIETETAAESATTSDLLDQHVEAILAGLR